MFRHITNGDTAELVINEVINKETLERAEELMQYFKGHQFVLRKVDAGLDIVFFNPIQFEQKRGNRFHRDVFFTQMQFRLMFALIFCVNILL